ncbi:hypothetical protein M427DRAFT_160179 [Gonapodya prolifera JEL478]|uniref:SH3 domain-containing protein n=1 Tax=Gonapodya prolifera (strain JEL478) TaxID=1344416 RepID=A0A138ZZ01_GONPJ|nr:hypothetical protein M427DRAFT_160179 [Gonapodya prolifera JEL478]|eukprot:KXS09742.1 hypothetical protein M427DRAFT_160179 [Gonapodya prolifera JEL478]
MRKRRRATNEKKDLNPEQAMVSKPPLDDIAPPSTFDPGHGLSGATTFQASQTFEHVPPVDTQTRRSTQSSRKSLSQPRMPSKALSDGNGTIRSDNLDAYYPPGSTSIQPSIVRAPSTVPSSQGTLTSRRTPPRSSKKIGSKHSKAVSNGSSVPSFSDANNSVEFEEPEAQIGEVQTLHPFFDYLARPLNQLDEPTVPYRGLPMQALVEYNPTQEDEIYIDEGTMIVVNLVFRDGWAAGTNLSTGETGAFPVDCLDLGPLNYLMAGASVGNRFESNVGSHQLPRTASLSLRSRGNSRGLSSKNISSLTSGSSGRTATTADVRGPSAFAPSRYLGQEDSLMLPPSGFSGISKYRSTAMPLIPSEVIELPNDKVYEY